MSSQDLRGRRSNGRSPYMDSKSQTCPSLDLVCLIDKQAKSIPEVPENWILGKSEMLLAGPLKLQRSSLDIK